MQGDLQQQVMRTVWRLGSGTVEEVRAALPRKQRGAYSTIQTVLNRLATRGLLERAKAGKAIRYTPTTTEADYVARSLNHALAGASQEARRAALASLVGGLDRAELKEIRQLQREIERKRR
jgi:predicted transcriptional regulator